MSFRPDILNDRVALITGGAGDINFGIAKAFVEHGASVALVSRSQDKLDRAASELSEDGSRARGFSADVRDPDQLQDAIDRTIAAFSKIDILVNGAAGNFISPAAQLSPNGFKTVMDIDCLGTFNATRLCFDQLCENNGVVLNITATQAWLPTPLQIHAGAAKAAITKMTMDWALEWGPLGIRVVALAPGPIDGTEGMRKLAPGDMKEQIEGTMPLKRFGAIDEIAAGALFLCSDAASFVTGTTLVVDGGQSLVGAPFLDLIGL